MNRAGRTFDPTEIENYLRASKLSPRDELVHRLALAGLAPRCRAHGPFRQRLEQLRAGMDEDEIARASAEACVLALEWARPK